MAKMTLVVLAAGMGTRFGTRIKQLEKLGPSGELLIDYSVHDAVKAGFDRVVFIIGTTSRSFSNPPSVRGSRSA